MNAQIEKMIWKGEAQFKTLSAGIGKQFVLNMPPHASGIITGIEYSPITLEELNEDQYLNSLLNTLWISSGRKANPIQFKNFNRQTTKETAQIETNKIESFDCFIPFEENASIFINSSVNNQAQQQGAVFNQTVRGDMREDVTIYFEFLVNEGVQISSFDQQFWVNKYIQDLDDAGLLDLIQSVYIGCQDSGSIEMSLYDVKNPAVINSKLDQTNATYLFNGGIRTTSQGVVVYPTIFNSKGLYSGLSNHWFVLIESGFQSLFNTQTNSPTGHATNREITFYATDANGGYGYGNGSDFDRTTGNIGKTWAELQFPAGLVMNRRPPTGAQDADVDFRLDDFVSPTTTTRVFGNNQAYGAFSGTTTAKAEFTTSLHTIGAELTPAQALDLINISKDYCRDSKTPAPAAEVTAVAEGYLNIKYVQFLKPFNGKIK